MLLSLSGAGDVPLLALVKLITASAPMIVFRKRRYSDTVYGKQSALSAMYTGEALLLNSTNYAQKVASI